LRRIYSPCFGFVEDEKGRNGLFDVGRRRWRQRKKKEGVRDFTEQLNQPTSPEYPLTWVLGFGWLSFFSSSLLSFSHIFFFSLSAGAGK